MSKHEDGKSILGMLVKLEFLPKWAKVTVALAVLGVLVYGMSGCSTLFAEQGVNFESTLIQQYCKQLGEGARADHRALLHEELGEGYEVHVHCPGDSDGGL